MKQAPWDIDSHCWDGLLDDESLRRYIPYHRHLSIGSQPALVIVDAYERVLGADTVTHGPDGQQLGARAVVTNIASVLTHFRELCWPVVHVTDARRLDASASSSMLATHRLSASSPKDFDFVAPLEPVVGELVIYKRRASAFYGTELHSFLTQIRSDSVVVAGETTSGCVRASAVDAFSSGFHVSMIEEACYDRAFLPHAMSLFDLHHKYADILSLSTFRSLLP